MGSFLKPMCRLTCILQSCCHALLLVILLLPIIWPNKFDLNHYLPVMAFVNWDVSYTEYYFLTVNAITSLPHVFIAFVGTRKKLSLGTAVVSVFVIIVHVGILLILSLIKLVKEDFLKSDKHMTIGFAIALVVEIHVLLILVATWRLRLREATRLHRVRLVSNSKRAKPVVAKSSIKRG